MPARFPSRVNARHASPLWNASPARQSSPLAPARQSRAGVRCLAGTCLLAGVLLATGCSVPAAAIEPPPLQPGPGEQFGAAVPVTIEGFSGQAMEPFVTRDGKYLFFNDSNDPSVDTNLHWARRVNDVTFAYEGQVPGVNSPQLDGVPSIDAAGVLYFVSPRSYGTTLSTLHRARWQGDVAEIGLVPGISERVPGMVSFDVEVSADGNEIVLADGEYRRGDVVPRSADLLHAYRQGDAFMRDPASRALFATVNTPALEYAASLSADGRELFFTRADPARGIEPGIWRARRAGPTLPFGHTEPVPAAAGYAEGPSISGDGRTLYFHRRGPQGFSLYCVQRERGPSAAVGSDGPARGEPDSGSGGRAKDEVDRAHDAEAGPEIVEAGRFAHAEHRERHE